MPNLKLKAHTKPHLNRNSRRSRHLKVVKLKRLWCNGLSFLGYQLENGSLGLVSSQLLPSSSRQLYREVMKLIQAQKLPTVEIILPNHFVSTLYPLETVKAVWNYLDDVGKLPQREREILRKFQADYPVEEKEPLPEIPLLSTAELSPVSPASQNTLQLKKSHLIIWGYQENSYITDSDGLEIIGVPCTWLVEASLCHKKTQLLKKRGYTGAFQLIPCQDKQKKLLHLKMHSLDEWLSIWSYFASKGNTKAADILRCLASAGIKATINTK